MEPFSSCHIVTLLCCVVEAQMVCVEGGGYPSIYTRLEVVLEVIFGTSTGLHHLYMLLCNR